jgi:hypothetical protein
MSDCRLSAVAAVVACCVACSGSVRPLPADNTVPAVDGVSAAKLQLYWAPQAVTLKDWNTKYSVLLFSPSLDGSIAMANHCSQRFILFTPHGAGDYKKLEYTTWGVTGYARGPYTCSVVASYRSLTATLSINLKTKEPRPRHEVTFVYTGSRQSFTVPAGVTSITVVATGGGTPTGSKGPSGPSYTGANGGLVKATMPVTPGEALGIYVGGAGAVGIDGAGGTGGFNGGGAGGKGIYGGSYSDGGCGGGGSSDVRQGGNGVKDRVVVAAGAGGGGIGVGFYGAGGGGAGGGATGVNGGGGYPGSPSGDGGSGGTQARGGIGGPGGHRSGYGPGESGFKGKRFRGGPGGGGTQDSGGGGGGGGGGYYGGGGGGAGSFSTSGVGGGGGGGGGSSYVEASATHVKDVQAGGTSGNGQIVIYYQK